MRSFVRLAVVMATVLGWAAAPTVSAAAISLKDDGIGINMGSMGEFTIQYPLLLKKSDALKPIETKVHGKSVALKYDGGASLGIVLEEGGVLKLSYHNFPADAKGVRMSMLIDFNFSNGGSWKIGDKQSAFPKEKPEKPHLFQGHGETLTLTYFDGRTLSVSPPPYSWLELTDNREWNWKTFALTFNTAYGADRPTETIKIGTSTKPAAGAAALSLSNDGVVIGMGSMGNYTLAFPEIVSKSSKQNKPIKKTIQGKKAALKYEGGAAIDLEIQDGTTVGLSYSNFPADAKDVRMDMLIDFNISSGGKWKIDGTEKEFPKEKPAKPHLFQGHAKTLTLTNFDGRTLAITVPDHSWHELTDNREWNWKTFAWWFGSAYGPDRPTATIKIEGSMPGGVKNVVVVDEFGQDAVADFPQKLKSLDELKKDIDDEKAWAAKLPAPERDTFGGVAGSGAKLGLQKTGFFHVEKKGERWVLVNPDGNEFFHLGLCTFGQGEDYTYIKGRESQYAWLPKHDSEFKDAYHPNQFWNKDAFSFYLANVIRKYGSYEPTAHASRMIERVRKIGFNSGGAFSGIPKEARDGAKFPYVGMLPAYGWGEPQMIEVPGIRETLDPFEEANQAKLEKRFAGLAAAADDPLLIGYFLCNEPNHEDLPRAVASQTSAKACKRRLIQMLKEKYATIEPFNAAWGTKYTSWEQAADAGLPISTKAAGEDMHAYGEIFFDAYYKMLNDNFRRVDKNHMLIGNRWQPQTGNLEQLARLAGKYCEVISVNYYTYGLDTDYLKRMHQRSGGKPIFLSEFYWAAPKESGLPAGSKEVNSQRERGLAYRGYVEQAASLGFVVGIEWFTLIDQARTGRFFEKYNAENANCGLFSVADRPWRDMAEEMAKTHAAIYAVAAGEQKPFVFDHPRFTGGAGGRKRVVAPRAPGAIAINGRFEGWPGVPPELIPRSRVVEGAAGETEAEFRLCWDAKNLYVLVGVADPAPLKNSKSGAEIGLGDGIEIFAGSEQMEKDGALLATDRRILFAATPTPPAPHVIGGAAAIETIAISRVDGKGYTVQAAIPWAALNVTPEIGKELLFDIAVNDSADGEKRERQLMWNGSAKNASERTQWGRIKLGQ